MPRSLDFGGGLAGMILGGEVCIWRRKADLKGKMRDCPGDSSGRKQGVRMPSPGEFSQKCVATEGKGSQASQCVPSPPLRLGKGSMGSAFCASLRSECESGPNSQVQLERQFCS